MKADAAVGENANDVSPRTSAASAAVNRSHLLTNYRPNLPALILVIILVVSSLLYYAISASERFGAHHDDSIYATTAKAMATGQGYRIISLPDEPAQTKYPPFYPFLLSLIWKVFPAFPENIVWMTMISTVSTLCFLFVTYAYLTKRGYATPWQALVIVGLTGINWRTMILATSMYSEMVYAALSVTTLYLAEKDENETPGWIRNVFLGSIIGVSFLTRSSGLALLIAVGLYYLLRRRWRKALVVVGVASLFVLGWIAWCYANKPADGVNAAYYGSYFRDISEMISGLQMERSVSKIEIFLTILRQNVFSAIVVSIPTICAGLSYGSIPGLGEYGGVISVGSIFLVLVLTLFGFVRQIKKRFGLLHIYLVFYVALHLPVPYISYDRYLVPLLPFLLLFLVTELSAAIALAKRSVSAGRTHRISVAFIALVVAAITCVGLYGYCSGIVASIAAMKPLYARAIEDRESIEWIKANTDRSEILICYRDPTYYLYTQRKAVPLTIVKRENAQHADPSLLLDPISSAGARYLVVTPIDFDHDFETDLQQSALKTLLEQYSKTFVLVFESRYGHTRIYRIDTSAV